MDQKTISLIIATAIVVIGVAAATCVLTLLAASRIRRDIPGEEPVPPEPAARPAPKNSKDWQMEMLQAVRTGNGLLEIMVNDMAASRKSTEDFYRSIFPDSPKGSSSGYHAVSESEEAVMAEAKRLQNVYHLSWQEALDRARNMEAYRPNGGMRESA